MAYTVAVHKLYLRLAARHAMARRETVAKTGKRADEDGRVDWYHFIRNVDFSYWLSLTCAPLSRGLVCCSNCETINIVYFELNHNQIGIYSQLSINSCVCSLDLFRIFDKLSVANDDYRFGFHCVNWFENDIVFLVILGNLHICDSDYYNYEYWFFLWQIFIILIWRALQLVNNM